MLLLWLFCAVVGAAISSSKNRGWTEGALLGGLLGILGVIIELFMRTLTPNIPRQGWYPDPGGSGSQRYWNGREWSDLPPRAVDSRAPRAVQLGAAPSGYQKECPDCAETILAAAKVCKHCGYRFAPSSTDAAVAKGARSVKVKCSHCEHVQTVPSEQVTFDCEECGAKLKRRVSKS